MSAEADAPLGYIARTHAWYGALGYAPYRYAQFEEVPFAPLRRPLAAARVALVTTAAPHRPARGDQEAVHDDAVAKFYEVYSGDTSADHDLRVTHVAVDLAELSGDPGCWFPLPALRRAAARGRIGALTPRFHGAPTNRSQRHTMEVDVPELLRRCREDAAEAVVLVANCPVCHQTLSLAARALEAAGFATVVMGAARDIVERCGVPRFLFSDVPLGNAAGLPWDVASQDATLEAALVLLETATGPRTTVQSRLRWPRGSGWKDAYRNPEGLSPADVVRLRAEHEASRAAGKAAGLR